MRSAGKLRYMPHFRKKWRFCGQEPFDHHDPAKWLMDHGIGSISLNPDTVVDTRTTPTGYGMGTDANRD